MRTVSAAERLYFFLNKRSKQIDAFVGKMRSKGFDVPDTQEIMLSCKDEYNNRAHTTDQHNPTPSEFFANASTTLKKVFERFKSNVGGEYTRLANEDIDSFVQNIIGEFHREFIEGSEKGKEVDVVRPDFSNPSSRK